jgi:hypothetical protein
MGKKRFKERQCVAKKNIIAYRALLLYSLSMCE